MPTTNTVGFEVVPSRTEFYRVLANGSGILSIPSDVSTWPNPNGGQDTRWDGRGRGRRAALDQSDRSQVESDQDDAVDDVTDDDDDDAMADVSQADVLSLIALHPSNIKRISCDPIRRGRCQEKERKQQIVSNAISNGPIRMHEKKH